MAVADIFDNITLRIPNLFILHRTSTWGLHLVASKKEITPLKYDAANELRQTSQQSSRPSFNLSSSNNECYATNGDESPLILAQTGCAEHVAPAKMAPMDRGEQSTPSKTSRSETTTPRRPNRTLPNPDPASVTVLQHCISPVLHWSTVTVTVGATAVTVTVVVTGDNEVVLVVGVPQRLLGVAAARTTRAHMAWKRAAVRAGESILAEVLVTWSSVRPMILGGQFKLVSGLNSPATSSTSMSFAATHATAAG